MSKRTLILGDCRRRRKHRVTSQILSILITLTFLFNASLGYARTPGDVWGRDLKVKGLGWIGHIGMDAGESVWDPKNRRSIAFILEVLNEGRVIVKSTNVDFLSRSPFWGGRYYSNCQKCYHNWTPVIAAGWEQRNWSPSYTYGAQYTEGKMVQRKGKWVRQNAQYRCDGFVIYSYKKGISLDVGQFPQTPLKVWNRLPYDYSWDAGV